MITEKILDFGLSQAKPTVIVGKSKEQRSKIRPKIETSITSETQKESSSLVATTDFSCGIDLIALHQICPPITKAIGEFLAFLKKIESQISREADAARLVGVAKAAKFLDVSDENIYRKLKRGTLEARWQGRRPYFPLSELERHINALPRKSENKRSQKRNS